MLVVPKLTNYENEMTNRPISKFSPAQFLNLLNNYRMIGVLFFLRMFDVATTWGSLKKMGIGSELNPIIRQQMFQYGIPTFAIHNLITSLLVCLGFALFWKARVVKVVFYIFLAMNFVVVITNLAIYLTL